MPKLMDKDLSQLNAGSNYKFSATKVDSLGASEYTLATLVVDESGSVSGFKTELEKAMLAAKQACDKSPRAENLLMRATAFANGVREVHGFKLLKSIKDSDYKDCLQLGGSTALNRATHEALEATLSYAKTLAGQEFLTNAIVVVVTDGDNNINDVSVAEVASAIKRAAGAEKEMESITAVLVGITGNQGVIQILNDWQKAVGITQFVDVGDVTPGKLAKLANFVSQSISSTSAALGTGQGSKPISFSF
jgi:uncharacterized protein YegL